MQCDIWTLQFDFLPDQFKPYAVTCSGNPLENDIAPLRSKSTTREIDEKYFNLLWRSIIARENELLDSLSQHAEESDEAALISNDIVCLRLCKKDLQEKAKKSSFSNSAFSLDDGFIDLANL